MMFTVRRTFFLLLTLATAIHAQQDQPLQSQIVHEAFLPIDSEKQGDGQHFLRGRQLQSTYCPAYSPQPYYVCGMPAPIPGDNQCLYSTATCSGLTYGCSCNGVATQCNYCEIRMAGAIQCQLGGTTTTYSDNAEGLITCQCVALGNGQVSQNCYTPTSNPQDVITQPPGSYYDQLMQQQQQQTTSMPVSQPTVPVYSLTVPANRASDPVYPEPVPITYPVPQPVPAYPVPVYQPVPQPVPAYTVPQPAPEQGSPKGDKKSNPNRRR